MEIKEGVAAAFYGAGIEEPAELAIPKKETDTRDAGAPKDLFFRVQIELDIKTIQLGYREQRDEDNGDPPANIPELVPFPSHDPVQDKSGADRQQYKRPLGHQGRSR